MLAPVEKKRDETRKYYNTEEPTRSFFVNLKNYRKNANKNLCCTGCNRLIWTAVLAPVGSNVMIRGNTTMQGIDRFTAKHFAFVFVSLACLVSAANADSVRKLEYGGKPEFKALAEQARQIGNELYPKVQELLSDGHTKLPGQFDIVIKQDYSSWQIDPLGHVSHKGTVIYLNGGALSYQTNQLEGVLVHEMAHVAQRYSIR